MKYHNVHCFYLVGERLASVGGSGIVTVVVSEKIGNIEADATRTDHSHTLTHLRRACKEKMKVIEK